MSTRVGTSASQYVMLPSDEWRLVPLHWHAFTHPAKPGSAPEATLYDPYAVATWVAERSGAHLWQPHFLIASRGDSIRHDGLLVTAVINEKCGHGCMAQWFKPLSPAVKT